MKKIIFFFYALSILFHANSQTMLSVTGNPNSFDTLTVIKATNESAVGLSVRSSHLAATFSGGTKGIDVYCPSGTAVITYSFTKEGVIGESVSNVGVKGRSNSGIGIQANSSSNHALYASTQDSTNKYAGFFQGRIFSTGTFQTSDARFKKKAKKLKNARALLSRLQPMMYEFKQARYPSMNLPTGQQYGLMAQEVEKVLPHLVQNSTAPIFEEVKVTEDLPDGTQRERYEQKQVDELAFKAINYTGLIPFLIAAEQEQAKEMDQLQVENRQQKAAIADLKTELANLKGVVQQLLAATQNPMENKSKLLKNALEKSATLAQNQPNPFNHNTLIDYVIPTEVAEAKIRVTGVDGQVLKVYDLSKNAKNKGQLLIPASDFPTGTYFYSLVLDGQVAVTKKMILQQ